MKTLRVVPLVVLLATTAAAPVDFQHTWRPMPSIDSYTTPAVSSHPANDGVLYVATVAATGYVALTWAGTPDGWWPWMILGPAPCPPLACGFIANNSTPPVFVSHLDTLYLFARGIDDNLYVIRKPRNGGWDGDWQQVTTAHRVRGPFSVALTKVLTEPVGVHLLYESGVGRIEARHLDLNWTEIGTPRVWLNVEQGTLASDGDAQLLVVLRSMEPPRLVVETKSWPWNSTWHQESEVLAPGPQGQFFDISNSLYYAHAFHVAFAYRVLCDDISPIYCYELSHLVIPRGQPPGSTVSLIAPYQPAPGFPAKSALTVYRNKLIAAWTESDGQVRYSRLDTADPEHPWVGGGIVDAGIGAAQRPGLGALNRRPFMPWPDYGTEQFGDDLFAAVPRQVDDAVYFINFSRAILLEETTRQLSFWESNEQVPTTCLKAPSDADLITDPFTDGRPIYTEVGFNIWMLPDWLAGHIFADAGRRGCLAGNPSGRFFPPCDDATYPVILRPVDDIFICEGVWIGEMNAYLRAWEEFGHSLAGMLGLHDKDMDGPTQQDADESGIALLELIHGHQIFGESLGTSCSLGYDPDPPTVGRCRGFTGVAGNYDATSRNHSFIYAVLRYVGDGDMLRDHIARDEAVGPDLLRRKYEWIKWNIFRGVEFKHHSDPVDPWNVDCTPAVQLTCGGSYKGNTHNASDRLVDYPCTPYAYSGPERAHTVHVPYPTEVTVRLDGLTDDLDLLLLQPGSAACDSSHCTQGSTAGGTSAELLSFPAMPGMTYHLLVDGYADAESVYTLEVSCAYDAIGEVPGTGNPLQIYPAEAGPGEIDLFWGEACAVGGLDYAVYMGSLGDWYTHDALVCSTGGVTWHRMPVPEGDVYFLVSAHNGVWEGSHGLGPWGDPRPQGMSSCMGSPLEVPCP